MTTKEATELAEKHWQYTAGVIKLADTTNGEFDPELLRYLYVQAMVHGIKHGEQGR